MLDQYQTEKAVIAQTLILGNAITIKPEDAESKNNRFILYWYVLLNT